VVLVSDVFLIGTLGKTAVKGVVKIGGKVLARSAVEPVEVAIAKTSAKETVETVVEKAGAIQNPVSNPLREGLEIEAKQLAEQALTKNTAVWRPTIEQTQGAAFQVIVGVPKFTKGVLLKGTIFDATEAGLLEIKSGASALTSTYQLRLQTYLSVLKSQPYIIRTTRPINPAFGDWLKRWGVKVEVIK
jgi:hypothetical protein